LLHAVGQLRRIELRVLVVGRDDPTPYQKLVAKYHLGERVFFLPIRPDVEFYYAAADAYVGPSLEDAFPLPPIEAMACGLPLIESSHSGVSEIVTDGVDALVLRDPRDARELAGLIDRLSASPELRRQLGENAINSVRTFTWDRNAEALESLIQATIQNKTRGSDFEANCAHMLSEEV
jgi:UDP-glucose:(heptosyl)LPS alpha-1,3-glucosyltransferase